jgi:hypothetical protein
MTNRTIKHEIKLEKSVKIILAILAVGVFLNAFAPAFSVKEAFAELSHGSFLNVDLTGKVDIYCKAGTCRN